jgi:hypothetical protein
MKTTKTRRTTNKHGNNNYNIKQQQSTIENRKEKNSRIVLRLALTLDAAAIWHGGKVKVWSLKSSSTW